MLYTVEIYDDDEPIEYGQAAMDDDTRLPP